jgi:hypothetical protein
MIYEVSSHHLRRWRNLFMGNDEEILSVAAQMRALKLMLKENFSPLLVYHPHKVEKMHSLDFLPTITEDGENIIDVSARFNRWIVSESKKGNIFLKNGKLFADDFVSKMRSLHSLILYKHPFMEFVEEETLKPENLMAVHKNMGFLSKENRFFSLNSLFFAMEITDTEHLHTYFGQPYGLTINEGKVLTPPLFKRGVFRLRESESFEVKILSAEEAEFLVDQIRLIPSENCEIWRRPNAIHTSKSQGDVDMVVINDRIISWKENGDMEIPDAGFVIRVNKGTFKKFKKLKISYPKMEDIYFAVQGGPVLIKNGEMQNGFGIEEFGGKVHYPPTVFPFDWDETPAARVAIGNKGKNVVILAVEGCNRYPYEMGFDSRGFTLKEMAEVMKEKGVENALNLDGGGSMQVRFLGAKALKYADRRGIPYHEFERPIPAAVFI